MTVHFIYSYRRWRFTTIPLRGSSCGNVRTRERGKDVRSRRVAMPWHAVAERRSRRGIGPNFVCGPLWASRCIRLGRGFACSVSPYVVCVPSTCGFLMQD
ncbi:hypothetical protein GQ53DRAFT_152190 [Thozetella sp. PMI_491]|nr:hypothetical protein GQ53DRAFT_152190 [Thozetella sp. PMI_491]